jgi:YihY family inner membrane protein
LYRSAMAHPCQSRAPNHEGKAAIKERLSDFRIRAERFAIHGLLALESVYKVLITNRRWFAAVSAAAEDFWAKKMYYYTGNFTYNAFLAILALLVCLSALIGLLARSANISQEVTKTLKNVVPIFGTTPQKTLDTMKTYRSVAGVIGIVGLIWTGTKIFGAMEWGFCEIWGSRRRNYAKGKIFGTMLISIIGLLFLGAFVVQFGFTAFWDWAAGSHGAVHDIGLFAAKPLIGFAIDFGLFLVIYKIVPTIRQRWRDIAVGAAVSAALFLGVQYLLAFYFGSISKVPSVYGSVSTVIILLIWLHVTGLITFFGAEIIYVTQNEELLEEHRARVSGWSFIPKSLRARLDGADDP